MIRLLMSNALAILTLIVLGCSSGNKYAELRDVRPLYVEGVPFYPQLEAQCGPASLAAVLNYWGQQVTPEEIAREIYVPRLKGSLSLDLWRYAGNQMDAAVHRGSLEYLQAHLMRNEPIVASLNLGYKLVPLGHYLVVVGLEPANRMVIAYSGTEKNSRIPFDEFLSAWEKTGYWALLVKPRPDVHLHAEHGDVRQKVVARCCGVLRTVVRLSTHICCRNSGNTSTPTKADCARAQIARAGDVTCSNPIN